jgi:glycosyltransferase involved in cell wall biosynthesis
LDDGEPIVKPTLLKSVFLFSRQAARIRESIRNPTQRNGANNDDGISSMSAQLRAKVLATPDQLGIESDLSSAVTVLKDAEVDSEIIATIVIPAYNEEKGLRVVLERLFRAVDGQCEVLVVDDGSHDTTSNVARGFRCGVIRHERNRGKGEAMKTGIRHARGDYVIFIDADGTYPTEVIPQMAEALAFSDVVYCSRARGRDNIPRLNRLGNAFFQNVLKYVYGFEACDYSTGLYGIRKRHLQKMRIDSRGFAIEPEIAIKASRMKLKMHDIPIQYQPRIGKPKLCSFSAGFEHLKTVFRLLLWHP